MSLPQGSLQRQLIRSILRSSMMAGVIAFILLIAHSIYQSMQMHDDLMDEVSDMLLISDLSRVSGQQLDELSDEFDLQYEMRLGTQLLTHSTDYQPILFQGAWQQGYGWHWQQHQLWRCYVQQDRQRHLTVVVVQPVFERFEDFFQTIALYAAVLVFLWTAQWWMMHRGIQRSFQSLHQVRQQIVAKNSQDLSPIDLQSTPTEIQPLLTALNQLFEQLQRALHAEQRFTADASHELRSPLSAMSMRLQVLQRKYQQVASLGQDLQPIQQDIQRTTQVLENLLLLARLDPTHATQLPKQELDLVQLLQQAFESIQPYLLQKKISLDAHLPDRLILMGNQELLFSAVRNLLDNAARYVPEHGTIFIELLQKDRHVIISIADNGQGVDEAILTRLGERFFRVLGNTTQGSGLGLSIVKKIVALHQGTVDFQQATQGGLQVRIELPQ